ncbi:MAG TPA: hypothetical protein G4O12_05365 [Dehalococcoidia bacterium]|nr:hypothetical protein [Dehalococcoidia bacterium]
MAEIAKIKKEHEEGWRLASVSGGEHLRRTLDMYQKLGIEVFLEEVKPEECAGCTECYKLGNETIYRIRTRAKDEQSEEGHGRQD